MVFVVPRHPLTPRRVSGPDIDASVRIVRREELLTYRSCEQALAEAAARADAIVNEAKEHFESEQNRGYAIGEDRARREAAAQMAENTARARQYFDRAEERLTSVVMAALRRIAAGFQDHERVMHVVHDALSVVRNEDQVTLKVNPQHVEHVRSQVDALLLRFPGMGMIDVVGDGRLATDACVVETPIGIVEADTQGQLAAIEEAFRKVGSERAEGRL